MASLTRSTLPSSRMKVPTVSDEEFPGLNTQRMESHAVHKKSAWAPSGGPHFAEMARSWGVQQKEEEEERKRLAKERVTSEQQQRERENKERSYFRIVDPTRILYGGRKSEVTYDLGGDQDELVAEVYDDEPEPEQVVEDVSYRRSKHELY